MLQKIRESVKRGILSELVEDAMKVERKYTQFIKHKVGNLTVLGKENFLRVDESAYMEYKECSDYKKIMKIAREYSERYQH